MTSNPTRPGIEEEALDAQPKAAMLLEPTDLAKRCAWGKGDWRG